MKLRFLGTGDARQVPVWGCHCPACERALLLSTYQRTGSCVVLTLAGRNFLIDAGNTRLAERFAPNELAGIFLSHFHADHLLGLFHLRWGQGEPIPVHCPRDRVGCADLYKNNGLLDFRPIKKAFQTQSFALSLDAVTQPQTVLQVTAIPLNHSKATLGYCFEAEGQKFAYLCDTKGLPAASEEFLLAWQPDLLIIDCTFPPGLADAHAANHNDLTDVLDLSARFASAGQRPSICLTHLSHQMDSYLMAQQNCLPENVWVAYDNQEIALEHGNTHQPRPLN